MTAAEVANLTVVERDGTPMVFDLDLGTFLEFERPRDMRKIVRRAIGDGFLSDSEFCATVAQNNDPRGRGRPGTEFHLTQTGALLIVTRSNTKRAQHFTRGIVRVFEDHLLGRLPGNDNGLSAIDAKVFAELSSLRSEMAALRDSIMSGMITRPTHNQLRADVRRNAQLEVAARRWPSTRAATRDIYRELGDLTGWGGKGQPWKLLPAALVHTAFVVLRGREASVRRDLRLLAADRQLPLPHVPVEREREREPEPEPKPKKPTTH